MPLALWDQGLWHAAVTSVTASHSKPLISGCPPFLIVCFIHPNLPDWRSPCPHWYWFGDIICTLGFVLLLLITHFKVESSHSRNAQAWCPPLYSLYNTDFQEEGTVGREGRQASESWAFSFLCLHTQKKKSKIIFKTPFKIAGMLFLLTLHKNYNQRAFLVYSSNRIIWRENTCWSSEWQGEKCY